MTVERSSAERAGDTATPSEATLRDVVDRIADGIVALDRNLVYTYVNESAARVLGRDAQSLIGKHAWTEFPESVGSPFEAAIERALRDQVVVQIEAYFEPWKKWYENRVHPSPDGLTIFFSDVTERRLVESDLQQQLAELDAIHGASRRLRDLQTPEALTASIIAILEESFGYQYGAVLTIEPGTGRLVVLAASRQGKDDEFERQDRAFIESMAPHVGKGVVGWVAQHGKPVRLADVAADPRYIAFRGDVRSELCVPIIVGTEVLGVVNVESRDLDAYSESDQRVLETIAAHIGVALQNTRLMSDLQRTASELESLHQTALDLIERRSLPDLLEAVVERAAMLAGSENGFIYVVDESGESASVMAGTGQFAGYLAQRLERGQGISGQAWATGKPIAIVDYATYEHAIERYIGTPVGSGPMAAIPLVGEQGVIGVLGLGRPGGPPFEDADIAVLERFGKLATLAMEGVRLTASVEDELGRRTAAEAALRTAEARNRALIEQLPGAVYLDVIQADGLRTTYVSPQIEAILGHPPDWFYEAGRWFALVHEDDRARYIASLETMTDRGPHQAEYRMLARDGRTIWVQDAWLLLGPADGPPEFVQGILTDVTERHRLEHGLSQAVKMEAVGRLAGGIAHDFNNLLTAIGGYATLLSSSLASGDARREDADAIVATTERAADLVRQLLAFSRPQIEAPVTLDLNEAIGQIENLIRRMVGADIELSTNPGDDVGHVRMDPSQLEQIVVNLVVNARDAMPEGGVLSISTFTSFVDRETAEIRGIEPGRFAVVQVQDTGIGVDEAVRAQLFEPFFTTKEPGRGTGLGLSTVYGVVSAAGGWIDVASTVGVGSTFTIHLPSVPPPSSQARAVAGFAPADSRGTERVLVVEDEPAVRRLAVRALKDGGYTVIEASDGEEAARIAGSSEEAIDLVVSDVIMPGVRGGTAVADVRGAHPRARVLFMTGFADPGTLAALDGPVLSKPFTPRELRARVRAVLDDPSGDPS